MSSTKTNTFQIDSNLNATANPPQKLYQPHVTPNIQNTSNNFGPSASVLSPSSFPTVNPINPPPVNTENSALLCVDMNESSKILERLDHQSTPEEYLHQTDAQIVFTMVEQLPDLVVFQSMAEKVSKKMKIPELFLNTLTSLTLSKTKCAYFSLRTKLMELLILMMLENFLLLFG